MKKFFRVIGYTFLAVGILLTVAIFGTALEYSFNPGRYAYLSDFKTCMKGKFLVMAPKDRGFIDVGGVEICGTDMQVSPVYGPSMEAHIESLRQENVVLKAQLDICQERQSL